MGHHIGHDYRPDPNARDEMGRGHLLAALRRVAAAGQIAEAVARLAITEGARTYRVYPDLRAAAQRGIAATLARHGPAPVADYLKAVTAAIGTHTQDPTLGDRALAYLTWLHRQAGIHPANPSRVSTPTNPDPTDPDTDDKEPR